MLWRWQRRLSVNKCKKNTKFWSTQNGYNKSVMSIGQKEEGVILVLEITVWGVLESQPIDPHITRSSLRKCSTVMRMEQIILMKPLEAQSADTIKKDVCDKLDPIEFSVIELRLRVSGEVARRCESHDLALKFVTVASACLSNKYTVGTQTPLKPGLKIDGFSKDMTEGKLLACLEKQNPGTSSLELNVNCVS